MRLVQLPMHRVQLVAWGWLEGIGFVYTARRKLPAPLLRRDDVRLGHKQHLHTPKVWGGRYEVAVGDTSGAMVGDAVDTVPGKQDTLPFVLDVLNHETSFGQQYYNTQAR